ncbi:MAG: hypothetical protein ACI8TP_003968 [Acidimicrobiales bacterium]|jgi:hypothetical protein
MLAEQAANPDIVSIAVLPNLAMVDYIEAFVLATSATVLAKQSRRLLARAGGHRLDPGEQTARSRQEKQIGENQQAESTPGHVR